jgi:hypothetical protein
MDGLVIFFHGNKTKRQLVAHGDSSTITNCQTNFPSYFERYTEFIAGFQNFFLVFISRFLAKPIMMFYGNLVGKHCLRQCTVQANKDIIQILRYGKIL